jgi:hypothetical protein
VRSENINAVINRLKLFVPVPVDRFADVGNIFHSVVQPLFDIRFEVFNSVRYLISCYVAEVVDEF